MNVHRFLHLRRSHAALIGPQCRQPDDRQRVDISANCRYLRLFLSCQHHTRAEAWVNVDDLLLKMDTHLPGIPWTHVPLGYLILWLNDMSLSFLIEDVEWRVQQWEIPGHPLAETLSLLPATPCPLLCQQWPDAPDKPAAEYPPLSAQVPFTLRYIMGDSQLPLSVLTEVAVGDLLLIKNSSPRLAIGQRALFYFSYHQDLEIIVEEQIDHARQTCRSEEEILFTWSELPVNIEFVLDSKTVMLKELDNLRPGMSLPVSAGAEQKVKIYLNSKLFARGELVALENGTLAVEISQLSQSPGSEATEPSYAD